MQTREIQLDSLFTDKFFEFKEEKEMSIKLPFPTPIDLTELPDFLTPTPHLEDKSNKFQQGFASIIDNFIAWCKENNIDSSSLDQFKKYYLEYDGKDNTKNSLNFHIYDLGVATLSGIVDQLTNEKIDFEVRKSIVENLLRNIKICGIGTLKEITSAYYELISCINAPIYWMNLRKNVAEQLIKELLKHCSYVVDHQIQYINLVLNRFSDSLGIQKVEDGYIYSLDWNLFTLLCDRFKKAIPTKLNLTTLIQLASRDLISSLPQLEKGGEIYAASIKQPNKAKEIYTDNLKRIERGLAFHGHEEEDKKFYLNDTSIIKLYGDLKNSITVDWKASNTIYLSLISRLIHRDCIDLSKAKIFNFNQTSVIFFPDQPIEFSYVQILENEVNRSESFIGFCVEELLKENSIKKDKIIETISELNKEKQAVFALNFIECLNSTYVKKTRIENNVRFIPYIKEWLINNDKKINLLHLLKLLELFPKENYELILDKELTFSDKNMESLLEIKAVISSDHWNKIFSPWLSSNINYDKLMQALKNLPQDKHYSFLKLLQKEWLNIIGDNEQLVNILNKFPAEHQFKFLTSFKGKILKFVQNGSHLAALLRPFDNEPQILHLLNLFKDNIKGIIKNNSEFIEVLKEIFFEQRMDFIISLKDKIHNYINNVFDLAETLPEVWDDNRCKHFFLPFCKLYILSLSDLLIVCKKEDEEDRYDFLNYLRNDWLQLILNAEDLLQILYILPQEEKQNPDVRVDLLTKLQPSFSKIFQDDDDLINVSNCLSKKHNEIFWHLLQASLSTIIKDGYELYNVMKKFVSPDQMRNYFMSIRSSWGLFIKDGFQLVFILKNLLKSNERFVFLKMFKNEFFKHIQDGCHLADVLNMLPQNQRQDFLVLLQDKLPEMVKNGYELASVLSELTYENRKSFWLIFKNSLSTLIQDGKQLAAVLRYLSYKDGAYEPSIDVSDFLKFIDKNLDNIICNGFELCAVLTCIKREDRYRFFMSIFYALPQMIESVNQLFRILSLLMKETIIDFLMLISTKLNILIQNYDQLKSVLVLVPSEQKINFISFISKKISTLIIDGDQLIAVLSNLSGINRFEFLANHKSLLSSITLTDKQFAELSQLFFDNQVDYFFKLAVIKNGIQLANALEKLEEDDQIDLLESLLNDLSVLIQDHHQFCVIWKLLPEHTQKDILNVLTAAMFKITDNGALLAKMFGSLTKENALALAKHINLVSIDLEIPQFISLLDNISKQVFQNDIASTLKNNILKDLKKLDSLPLLNAAYDHSYFAENNKSVTLFSSNSESDSQAQLKKRIEELSSKSVSLVRNR